MYVLGNLKYELETKDNNEGKPNYENLYYFLYDISQVKYIYKAYAEGETVVPGVLSEECFYNNFKMHFDLPMF